MNAPPLSVVTPTYQCGRYIRRTWWCLRGQSFGDWEWVVVDDGSTDETADLLTDIARQEPERVRVVRCPVNSGRGAARCAGLEAARGRHVVGWDMDDLAFPDRLERLAAELGRGVDFAASEAVIVDARLRPVGLRRFEDDPLLGRVFLGGTFAVRTELLRAIGYDRAARAGEDKRVVFTLAKHARGAYIEEPLYIYFETRDVSVAKAILDCTHELALLGEWARAAPAEEMSQWRRRLRWLRLKKAALLALAAIPGGYRLTVGRRQRGSVATLTRERLAFLERAATLTTGHDANATEQH